MHCLLKKGKFIAKRTSCIKAVLPIYKAKQINVAF